MTQNYERLFRGVVYKLMEHPIIDAKHLILHIPHSSIGIPSLQRRCIQLNDAELRDEILSMTDWYTDDLFSGCSNNNENIITFPISRLIVDPERFVEDDLEVMYKVGMGVIYTQTSGLKTLRGNPAQAEKNALIKNYYTPHHERLITAVNRSIDLIGEALIIDCHSFPSRPLLYELSQDKNRPDICIGADDFHTSNELTNSLVSVFSDLGYHVMINTPFSGALVPSRFYKKEERVQSVMIEINRKLYMDEKTGQKSNQFIKIKNDIECAVLSVISS